MNRTSSDSEDIGNSSLPNRRRKLRRCFTDLLTIFDSNKVTRMSQHEEEINVTVPSSEDSGQNNASRRLPISSGRSQPSDHAQPDEPRLRDKCNFTNFYQWLVTTVVLDDLSFRQPFINPSIDANDLTEQNMLLHGVRMYENLEGMTSRDIMNLPFIPRPMSCGETLMDIPFLDPLLIVLWDIHIDDLNWMLNVLPWRVIDRPIRTGRSILAWIFEIQNLHAWLESTRAPHRVTVKIIRFFDNMFEL